MDPGVVSQWIRWGACNSICCSLICLTGGHGGQPKAGLYQCRCRYGYSEGMRRYCIDQVASCRLPVASCQDARDLIAHRPAPGQREPVRPHMAPGIAQSMDGWDADGVLMPLGTCTCCSFCTANKNLLSAPNMAALRLASPPRGHHHNHHRGPFAPFGRNHLKVSIAYRQFMTPPPSNQFKISL